MMMIMMTTTTTMMMTTDDAAAAAAVVDAAAASFLRQRYPRFSRESNIEPKQTVDALTCPSIVCAHSDFDFTSYDVLKKTF